MTKSPACGKCGSEKVWRNGRTICQLCHRKYAKNSAYRIDPTWTNKCLVCNNPSDQELCPKHKTSLRSINYDLRQAGRPTKSPIEFAQKYKQVSVVSTCPVCGAGVTIMSRLGLCGKHISHFVGKNWELRKKGKPERTVAEYIAAYVHKVPAMPKEEALRRAAERQRKNYTADPKKYKELARKSREKNPEYSRLYAREYARSHPEKIKEQNRIRCRRTRNAAGRCTQAQWMQRVAYYGWKCVYCSKSLDDKTLTIDHRIPLAKNGTHWAANLVPACKSCNSRKRDKIWFR